LLPLAIFIPSMPLIVTVGGINLVKGNAKGLEQRQRHQDAADVGRHHGRGHRDHQLDHQQGRRQQRRTVTRGLVWLRLLGRVLGRLLGRRRQRGGR
jgi:hypothetical protein